jgi:hypothetical protein
MEAAAVFVCFYNNIWVTHPVEFEIFEFGEIRHTICVNISLLVEFAAVFAFEGKDYLASSPLSTLTRY